MRALLDTSFFVAQESGRPLAETQEVAEAEISVITLAELTIGVLTAKEEQRPARVATLSMVESTWEPLPVDAEVARAFARVVAELKLRGRRVNLLDALIAATAIVEEIPLVSQDRDYEAISGLELILV